jgi:LPS transport system D
VKRWQLALSLTVLALLLPSASALGQIQPPSDKLLVDAAAANTWSDGTSDIIQLKGPVTIRLDRMVLRANAAVIWLSSEPGLVIEQERAEIALVGDAVVREPARAITRSAPELFVTVAVRGDIRVSADQRLTDDQSDSEVYQRASALRRAAQPAPPSPTAALQPGSAAAAPGTTYRPLPPGAATRPSSMVRFRAADSEFVPTSDETLAVQLSGNVAIFLTQPNGDFIEIRADRAVLFTNEKSNKSFEDASGSSASLGNKITGAYLEGDVRMTYTPAVGPKQEQRLWAQRVYYDIVHNQAVLTDAILRTSDLTPAGEIPITIRAQKLRQLSLGEYEGEHTELSTSSFATPTYSVKTDQVYIEQDQAISPITGEPEPVTNYVAKADTLNFFDVPVFYAGQAAGSVDEDPYPLRQISISNTKRFGAGFASEFGLYESLGKPRPPGLDVSFLADYFSKRGEATGINADYTGANLDQDSNSFSDFAGRIHSFIISDKGDDQFNGERVDVTPPDETRGKFLFEHQQFFSDGWQAQIRGGYVSDPSFLEEYYQNEFYENQPYDAQAYLKHQQDTEAFTMLAEADTNRFPTTSDQQQENFDVEKLPEVGYQRIGDSLADDNLTFYSSNTVDRLRFAKSHFSLDQQGFVGISPGIPSEGYTGTISSPVYRGDTRQEVDYPIQLGQIKVVPYVIGRDTGYSDSPSDDSKNRAYGGAGVRMTTDFWKVDDTVQSDLFDIHRVRHIIEPEINLYTSGENVDRDQLYIYDENVDGISDVSLAEVALHQRWETYRGPPGKQDSVDFLSLNITADMYTNPPTDAGILPDKFRGLFFPSDPEASIPRDAINADATWLISDSTAVVADEEYDVDHQVLATASVGLAVKRYDRLAYYLGLRYIEQENSDLATASISYQLTTKYTLILTQSYDFGQKDVATYFSMVRQFDRLTCAATIYHDSTTGDSGFEFNVYPVGLAPKSNPSALFNPQ